MRPCMGDSMRPYTRASLVKKWPRHGRGDTTHAMLNFFPRLPRVSGFVETGHSPPAEIRTSAKRRVAVDVHAELTRWVKTP